ncbi:MAG: MFS transporter [Anaerolineales bacterium]|nr:MFS transporter [Anaerolineales bacterium]
MPNRPKIKKKPTPFYYGWVIVAVSALTLLVAFGTRLSFTVFFVALTAEFGWARADTALIFSVSMIVFAITSIAAGLALDRWGVRVVFAVGAGFLALGLFMSSQIDSLWQLAFTYGVVVGLGITILGLGLQAGMLANWFRKRLGLAIGIAFAGTGLGTLLLTPYIEFLISNTGWQTAYQMLAALALLLIPIILIFMRRSPAVMGLYVDGIRPLPSASLHQNSPLTTNWTIKTASHTLSFWLVIVAALFAIGPLRMLTVHQLAVMVDAGFNSLYAATVIGGAGLVTAIAFILFGTLSDRIGRRQTYVIGSICLVGAIVVLSQLQTPPQPGWLLVYGVLLGLGEGSRSSLVTAVASDLFPGQSLGAINGAVGSAFGAGAAFFPWLAGWIFDVNGDYNRAFLIAGLAIGVSTLALWMAPVIAERRERSRSL